MPTLLYVKSSIHGDAGQSSRLAKALVDDWLAQYPDGELIERDLVAEPLPHLDGERFAAFLSTPINAPRPSRRRWICPTG